MKQLKTSLQDWVKHQFITQQQAEAIANYEATRPSGNWVYTTFLALGLSIVGIGVIAIIAANWNEISDAVKLLVDFLILIVFAIGIVRSFNTESKQFFESLLFFFMIMCLATIGLISQIYHLHGEFYDALFFWSWITLPVALLSQRKFIPFVWTTAFLGALTFKIAESNFLFSLNESQRWLGVVMALPLFCAIMTSFLKPYRFLQGFAEAFRFWIFFTGIFSVSFADMMISNYMFSSFYNYSMQALYPSMVLALVLILGLLISKEESLLTKLILISIILLYVLAFELGVLAIHNSIIGALFSIVIFSLIAIYWGMNKHRRLFNFTTFLIGLRFLFIYFDAIGGLARTGVGLIISGLFIIGLVYMWHKNKNKWQTWLEGLSK